MAEWADSDLRAILRTLRWVVMLIDRAGRVRFCNHPLRQLRPSEIVGKSVVGLTPREHRAELAARLEDVFTGRRPQSYEEQWLVGSPEGGRWYENTLLAVKRKGKAVGAVLISREITTRKRQELHLAKLREQLEYAQRLANAGSWSWLVGSDTISWSQQLYRIFGLDPDAGMTYARYLDAVHPGDRGRVRAFIEEAASTLQPREFEHRLIRPSGEERRVHCRVFVADKPDRRRWMYGSARDVTEQRRDELERERLQHQAEAAIQARDAFLSLAVHEVKTPLTTLGLELDRSMAELEHATALGDRRAVVSRLQTAKRQARRVGGLVEVLLELPDLLARDLELDRRETDLVEVAHAVASRFEHDAARAGSPLRVVDGGPVVGAWDAHRLEQLLSQLVSNAIKFGRGRPVEIEVDLDEGDLATLTVRDHGIGIRPEERARIFERFARAGSERPSGGTGLGLWVVKQLVDALGGSVWVDSSPGEGATFTVHLPREAPAVEPRPRTFEDDSVVSLH